MVQGPRGAHDSPEDPDCSGDVGDQAEEPAPDDGQDDGQDVGPDDGPGDEKVPNLGGDPKRRPAAKPHGDVYEWYTRGMRLLKEGSPAAAAEILEHAAAAEPSSRSVREALARAQFDARRYPAAAESFRFIVEANPTEDYAYFGLGMALWRMGDLRSAVEQLSIANAMRPDSQDYSNALRKVRAGLNRRSA